MNITDIKMKQIQSLIGYLNSRPNYNYEFEIISTLDGCISQLALLLNSQIKCPATPPEKTQECDWECGEHFPISKLIEHPYGYMCAPCVSIANIEMNHNDENFHIVSISAEEQAENDATANMYEDEEE